MDENDAVLLTENYFYDNLQLKTVEQINQNGKTLIEYFYDDNDSLIEESRSANGSEFSLTKYAYFEEDGLKIKLKKLFKNSTVRIAPMRQPTKFIIQINL